MRDIAGAGGRIAVRGFASPAEIAALPETLIFNCTGLGARELFGDMELIPIRGQLAILIPQPEVRYAFTGEARSEEHTSELQSLMRISYAVFCLKKHKKHRSSSYPDDKQE